MLAIHARETGQFFLPLVTLSQGDWLRRLVPNTEPIASNGNTYVPFGFDIHLPDEEPGAETSIEFSADNVDLQLIEGLRQVTGTVDVTIGWVLADTPDLYEIGPFDLQLRGASYSALRLTGVLSIDPFFDRPAVVRTFNPSTAPGLF